MTPEETVILARYARALFPGQHFDEYTPDAWHDVIGHLSLADCRAACVAVNGRQPFIGPAEIVAEVRRIRADRFDQTPMPDPPKDLTGAEFVAWKRATLKAIGDGTYQPQPAVRGTRALPRGTDGRPDATGICPTRSVPAGRPPELADPQRELRRHARSVPCPHDTCRAREGKPCVGYDGKPLTASPAHHSRLVAAGLAEPDPREADAQ